MQYIGYLQRTKTFGVHELVESGESWRQFMLRFVVVGSEKSYSSRTAAMAHLLPAGSYLVRQGTPTRMENARMIVQ